MYLSVFIKERHCECFCGGEHEKRRDRQKRLECGEKSLWAQYGVRSLSEAGILEEENHQKKKCKRESDLDYEFLTQKKIDQRMNNRLLIVSLSCLFSKKKILIIQISPLLLKVPGCVQVLPMFLEY